MSKYTFQKPGVSGKWPKYMETTGLVDDRQLLAKRTFSYNGFFSRALAKSLMASLFAFFLYIQSLLSSSVALSAWPSVCLIPLTMAAKIIMSF